MTLSSDPEHLRFDETENAKRSKGLKLFLVAALKLLFVGHLRIERGESIWR